MTLPAPADTALADYTDWYIRSLAFAIDSQLNTVVKVAILSPTVMTLEAGGEFTAQFGGLGQLLGAIVVPAQSAQLAGPITTYPPVPPATYEAVLRPGYAWVGLAYLAVGAARCRVYQSPSDIGDNKGTPQQCGAQPVNGGQTLTVTGVAWAAG